MYSSETKSPLHKTLQVNRIPPNPILPEPSDPDYLRASDFKHCEDSCTEPFIWVKNAERLVSEENNLSNSNSCSKVTPLICEPLPSITTVPADNDDISKSSQFKLPKSYFSWSKDLSDFVKTGVAGYSVDSFSALKGYLSDKPQCVSEPPRGRVSAELSKPVERKGAMCVVLV